MGQYLATDPQSKAHYELDTACHEGKIAIVQAILTQYPQLLNQYLPRSGYTPLFVATEKNHPPLIAYLLTLDAIDINHNEENWTPLHIAAADNHLEALQTLLSHPDINPNVQCDESGDTPLHVASFFGLKRIVEQLLQHPSINTNLRNQDNQTAEDVCCHFLAEEEQDEKIIIQKLIQTHESRVF